MSPSGIRLAVAASTLSGDLRQSAKAARALGFAGVALESAGAIDLTALSGSGRREVRHLLSSHEQALVALRIDLGASGLLAGDVDRQISRLARTMEAAKGLGCTLICAEAGPLPSGATPTKIKPKITPEQAGLIIVPGALMEPAQQPSAPPPSPGELAEMAQLDAAMIEIGRWADRIGVAVAWRSELASFVALQRALRAADCPWFGLELDPVAVLRDEWNLDEVIARLGERIRHVRGRDALGGTHGRTKPAVIGTGSVDWQELIARLDETAYAGWLTIDPVELNDRAAAAASGRAHLAKL